MGTRNLTVVVVDGLHRVAQYGQWDGYPDGQGNTIANFLYGVLTTNRLSEFEDKVRATQWITPEQLEEKWMQAGAPKGATSVNLAISERFEELFPELHRDTGAKVLDIVLNKDAPLMLRDDINFALESLFCEFAYVIDLDAKVLEFYTGFNKDATKNAPRFMALPDAQAHIDKENGKHRITRYEAVALAGTFTFDELTQEGAQAIVDKMNVLIKSEDDED